MELYCSRSFNILAQKGIFDWYVLLKEKRIHLKMLFVQFWPDATNHHLFYFNRTLNEFIKFANSPSPRSIYKHFQPLPSFRKAICLILLDALHTCESGASESILRNVLDFGGKWWG